MPLPYPPSTRFTVDGLEYSALEGRIHVSEARVAGAHTAVISMTPGDRHEHLHTVVVKDVMPDIWQRLDTVITTPSGQWMYILYDDRGEPAGVRQLDSDLAFMFPGEPFQH